jgi:ApbE superfamily uncharacterized protein (UPF0280 family)
MESAAADLRNAIREHIERQPEFLSALSPVTRLLDVHPVIARMYAASEAAGVGPMAAVAGAVAEFAGRSILERSEEIVVENGGDIWLRVREPVRLGMYAGSSSLSGRVGIMIDPGKTPLGVCTSSGRVGPSFSFGRADAATVIAGDAALADATATGAGNLVKSEDDLEAAAEYAMSVPGVTGVLVIYRDRIIVQGDVELAPVD